MKDYVLQVEKLSKSFYPALSFGDLARFNFKNKPPTKALTDVSFCLKKGEILGILGPNGAGKTTLLKIISTLILPDKGKVIVNNLEVGCEDNKIKSFIGLMSSEERSFYWRLTGRQNLEFFATMFGLSTQQAKSKIQEFFEIFKINYAHKRFDSYSTGMKKTFSLIRALLHNPELLLLDEPTKSLDYHSSSYLIEFIKAQAKEGKAILLATHNMPEAENLCGQFMILHNGKVYGAGTQDELRKKINSHSASLTDIYVKLTQNA